MKMLDKSKHKEAYNIVIDLMLSVLVNVLFLFLYTKVYDPYCETNDDPAMAFFPEGIRGVRVSRLVYENIIFGKILEILQALIPSVRWYFVLQYAMIFAAFAALGYILHRVIGRITGSLTLTILLFLIGQHIYVTFQWTRTSAVITAMGMCLLYYGINLSEIKWERIITILVGGILCLFGSFIRIQMFAICVMFAGGILVCRLFFMLCDKNPKWKRCAVTNIFVYGAVGVLCIAGYIFDRSFYQSNDWSNYMKYNSLRSELWDFGFPDYGSNQMLYEKLGISYNDLVFYGQWNMDEEKLPLESLEQLVDAKDRRSIRESVKSFLGNYPKNFFTIPLFGIFVMVSLIAVLLNWRNLLLVIYEFAVLMVFEFYFVFIGRAGLARIDDSMLMAMILSVLCGMLNNQMNTHIHPKVAIALCGGILTLNMADISTRMINNSQTKTNIVSPEAEFLNFMTDNDNCLFILPTVTYTGLLSLHVGTIWEPPTLGQAKNICYTGGWEFNNPIVKDAIEQYGIKNIYRDCIDNRSAFFVSNGDVGNIQAYIQENYDANARICQVKKIACQGWENSFYIVRDAEIGISRRTKVASPDITHEVRADIADGTITMSGYAYKANSDSFQQYAYLKLKDVVTGDVTYYDLVLGNWEGSADIMNGAYSAISGSYPIEEGKEYEASVILEADGEYYVLDCAR